MKNNISKKTEWIRTDGWRGYVQPISAVAGVNDTGEAPDSPCRSRTAYAELEAFTKKLREAGIKYRIQHGESSNVFCVHHYVCTAPDDQRKAAEIAQGMSAETTLLYPVFHKQAS